MDLTKGRKSKNILDRRNSNKDAYVTNGGNRFADSVDFQDTYRKHSKPKRVELGDNLYESASKAVIKAKKKSKVLDKYKDI